MNRELGANFNINQFDHYAMYDPETGACKSYLVSQAAQNVKIGEETVSFDKDEYIYMEISQKYAVEQIDEMAGNSGFKALTHFSDSKNWFVDAIWQAV